MSVLRALTYHRVIDPEDPAALSPSLVSAAPATFERHVRHLARRYRVVEAEEVLRAVRGERALPERAVWLTFDDGYRDFGEVAWPILRRYGLPATLFVPTAFPGDAGREFWWDRIYRGFSLTERTAVAWPFGTLDLRTPARRAAALRRVQDRLKTLAHAEAMRLVERLCGELGVGAAPFRATLSWDELRELRREGVTIAPHTRTHPALDRVPLDEARAEICGSRRDVERELGEAPPVFAYPFGSHDEMVVRLVEEEGFEVALTCLHGHNRLPGDDPLRLRRTHVGLRTTARVFPIRLLGAAAAADRWRQRVGHRGTLAAPPRSEEPPRPGVPVKVAYITSRFPKLTETFVLNEMVALEAAVVGVELYPLLREPQAVLHPGVERWVRRARFRPFLSPGVLRAQAHFLRRQPRAYLRLWAEVLRGTAGSANFFLGALAILPKSAACALDMRERGVTHVHAHFATHPAVAALIVHRLTGIPFSFTAHGSDLHVERRMLGAKVAAAAFAVTVSDYNREVMVAECGEGAREKIHVIHCGVDADAFAPGPPRVGAAGPFRLACVASFEEVKGHRFLVEACRLLRERRIDFECHLVGEGPLRDAVEAQIARSGLGPRVRLHGGLPRPAVARLLRECDAAVLASHPTARGKREGIPVALMEAMASGLPVVASSISGIPELVDGGRTGFLVPSGDPDALADALAALARDPGLRARMGRLGRERVLEEFDLHRNALRLAALFAEGEAARRAEPVPAESAPVLEPV